MSSLSIVPAFQFNEVIFDVVDRNGQPWLKSSQLATALGYAREDKVTRLYQRNADEFTENMTQLIDNTETPISGFSVYATQVRIFSLRGCHLIAMFARTAVAKAFRKWVLDVLDSMHTQPAALPLPDRLATKVERRPLVDLVNVWVGAAPVSYRSAWQQVNANFGVTKADELTLAQVTDAIKWVQARIDLAVQAETAAQPTDLPVPKNPTYDLAKAARVNKEIATEAWNISSEFSQRIEALAKKAISSFDHEKRISNVASAFDCSIMEQAAAIKNTAYIVHHALAAVQKQATSLAYLAKAMQRLERLSATMIIPVVGAN